MIKINGLCVSPENYALDVYGALPDSCKDNSLMGDINRRFISGLIRLCKPKRILEIGVAFGGGTATVLNAIEDMPETSLYSIDRANKTKKLQNGYQTGDVCEIGYIAQETFPEFYQSGKAKLFIGKDASEIIESFHETFDFVILDTAHIHPIETLNFLTILPYLTDDAVVVLDDVMLHFESLSHSYATRLLFDTVVADKLCIDGDDYISQNVVAFQITADTHKYIADVFRSLMFPWNMLTSDIEVIQPFIERHYDDKLVHAFKLARKFNEDNLFRQAIGMRVDWFADVCGKIQKSSREYAFNAKKQTVESKLSLLKGKNVFFYGGGNYGKQIIAFLKKLELSAYLPSAIFDKNYRSLSEIDGITVVAPDMDIAALSENGYILLTMRDVGEADKIIAAFHRQGFENIVKAQDLELLV